MNKHILEEKYVPKEGDACCKHVAEAKPFQEFLLCEFDAYDHPVVLCNDCYGGVLLSQMVADTKKKIDDAETDPKLFMCVGGSMMYSYSGSNFDNYDLVFIDEICGDENVSHLFNEMLHNHLDFDGDECVIESSKTKVLDNPSRVLLRKIPTPPTPQNHGFNFIKVHGKHENLKLIQMFIGNYENKLPGEEGYIPHNDLADKSVAEYFKDYIDPVPADETE